MDFAYASASTCIGPASPDLPSSQCHGLPYLSSELVLLALAKLLTPVFFLPGWRNLLALGAIMCALPSTGIASLATGLRVRL
jgi:hypothetical protein